jgi:ribosomal silencing factor RsfS
LTGDKLRTLIEKILDDNKAEDIETIDLRGQSSLADFMIVASCGCYPAISGHDHKAPRGEAEEEYSQASKATPTSGLP